MSDMDLENEVEKKIEVEVVVPNDCNENLLVDFISVPERNIGRLRKTLGERCKECGSLLELRVVQENAIEDGEEILVDHEIKYCKVCDDWDDVKPKRKKKGGRSFIDIDEENMRDNGKYKKRIRPQKGNGKDRY